MYITRDRNCACCTTGCMYVVFSPSPCMMPAVPVQLGNSCREPWPPHNSGMWRVHTPMYCSNVTSVKKEVHWWLTYPEVFLHRSVWAGGWQTPERTSTLPSVPRVSRWWKGACSDDGYFRSPAIIPGPCGDTVPQWVLISITQSLCLREGVMNVVEASWSSGRSGEKRVSWNNPVPLRGTALCPCCVDPLCPVWWSKGILRALLQSHNLAKRSSKMRGQQHLSSIAAEGYVKTWSLIWSFGVAKRYVVTGESGTVQAVLSEL